MFLLTQQCQYLLSSRVVIGDKNITVHPRSSCSLFYRSWVLIYIYLYVGYCWRSSLSSVWPAGLVADTIFTVHSRIIMAAQSTNYAYSKYVDIDKICDIFIEFHKLRRRSLL
jgi:hypothetical protein